MAEPENIIAIPFYLMLGIPGVFASCNSYDHALSVDGVRTIKQMSGEDTGQEGVILFISSKQPLKQLYRNLPTIV